MNTDLMSPGGQQQQQQQQSGQSQSVTLTDLQAAMTAALSPLARQQQQPQPQQLSPEQIDQMLGTYRVDDNVGRLLFGDALTPQQLEALNMIVVGAVTNATKQAQLIAEHQAQTLYGHIEPHLNDAREYGQERFFGQLYEGHDGLKQFDPLLRNMLPQFEQLPNYPKTGRKAQAEFVRKQAIELIKQTQQDFDPTGQAQQQQQTRGNRNDSVQPAQPTQNNSGQHRQQPITPTLPSFGGGGGQGAATPRNGATNGGAKSSDLFTPVSREA